MPNPEYSVSCLMCNKSFSATADTLGELVDIVALHLRQVKAQKYKPHEKYLADNRIGNEDIAMLEKSHPENPSEILENEGFRWDILRLVPYNRIFTEVKIPLPRGIAPQTSTEKLAREETVHPKTS